MSSESIQRAGPARRSGSGQFPPLILPAALFGGMIASASADSSRDSLLIGAIALLVAGAWWVIWRVAADTRWTDATASWLTWQAGEPLPALPYTEPGSPSARVSAKLGRFQHWLEHELFPMHGSALFAALCALAVSCVMSAALGSQAFLLTLLFLAATQFAVYLNGGSGNNNRLLFNIAMISLPFLLGLVVYRPLPPAFAALPAVIFAVCAALAGLRARLWQTVGFGAILLLLLINRHTVGAFVIAVLWLPVLMLPGFRAPRWWPLLVVLIGALALS
jgi:hypothetical protein